MVFLKKDLLQLEEKEMRQIRRNDISMIFQEPMRSLNPEMSIKDQLRESYENKKNSNIDTEIINNLICPIL